MAEVGSAIYLKYRPFASRVSHRSVAVGAHRGIAGPRTGDISHLREKDTARSAPRMQRAHDSRWFHRNVRCNWMLELEERTLPYDGEAQLCKQQGTLS